MGSASAACEAARCKRGLPSTARNSAIIAPEAAVEWLYVIGARQIYHPRPYLENVRHGVGVGAAAVHSAVQAGPAFEVVAVAHLMQCIGGRVVKRVEKQQRVCLP
jgi:hypothetical protein